MLNKEKTDNVFAFDSFRCILGHKILSQEEENKLSALAINGDLRARNLLVCYNQKLVAKLALKLCKANSSLDFEDLYSEGNVGLIKAAERFDSTKGARFATFASYYVLDAMQTYAKRCSAELNRLVDIEFEEETLPDNVALIDVDFDKNIVLEELSKALAKLPQREREVLLSKFGVFGRNKYTLEVIGQRLGLTKQRVGQMEKAALKSLKEFEISMA